MISQAWLTVMATTAIGPVLPQMSREFRNSGDVGFKISLVATGPALAVALLAVPAGVLLDRYGRKRILLAALLIYGVAGTAPTWLPSLNSIIGSRVLVGIAEAAIMTGSTAMIGDYYSGPERKRWLAMQTGIAPAVAILFLTVGGMLGANGWRTPFISYGLAFLLAPLVQFLIWEPKIVRRVHEAPAPGVRVSLFSPGLVAVTVLTVFGMSAFQVTVIQSGFLFAERGLKAASLIGPLTALGAVATPIGALIFGMTRLRLTARLGVAFSTLAAGFAIIALVPGVPAVVAGSLVANFGSGFMLPTLITWALSALPPGLRGRGTGIWMMASFIGQFIGPLVILWLTRAAGDLDRSVLAYALACAGVTAGALAAGLFRLGEGRADNL